MNDNELNPSKEKFAEMLEAVMLDHQKYEQSVMKGEVIKLDRDYVTIDVGLKMEGRVSRREFEDIEKSKGLNVGDEVKVFVESLEDHNGEAVYSRELARTEEAWEHIKEKFDANDRVEGVITSRVRGGFTVEIGGVVAFLPGSQVDFRPVKDITPLLEITQPFKVLKMDKKRGNIVISRRAILEEDRSEQRGELVSNLAEGDIKDGIVKNLTPYGAFVELLSGVDGLLHVTDMSWSRINHPSEMLNINDRIKVKIIKINPETQRISLGIKQLHPDPWQGIAEKYKYGLKVTGEVSNVTDYGAFVDLGDGVEGLVHVTEMSWIKKNSNPSKLLEKGQKIEVMVLEVDESKRRVSLGIKQCQENPWDAIVSKDIIGTVIKGKIRNITEFGIFVSVFDDVDGMVHLSDIDWEKPGEELIKNYEVGQEIEVKVLDVDAEKERISLGIKQISSDPFEKLGSLSKGDNITVVISDILANGVEVQLDDAGVIKSVIKKSELSIDRSERDPTRFAVGDKVDAKITNIDRYNRKIFLSIKEREIAEEQKVVDQYGSTDSGASLGDILGPSLNLSKQESAEKEAKKETKKATKKASKDEGEEEGDDEKSASSTKKASTKKASTKKASSKKSSDADKKAEEDKE